MNTGKKMNPQPTEYMLLKSDFQALLDSLLEKHDQVLGPRVSEGTIQFKPVHRIEELAKGVVDQQSPGKYLLKQEGNNWFDWSNGPQAIKPELFAPKQVLWYSKKITDGTFSFTPEMNHNAVAVIGAKACDLAAMRLQNQHFLEQEYIDPYYQSRQQSLFIVAVNCSRSADTCFCHSTGDGPFCEHSYDLSLTELEHSFIIRAGSDKGLELLKQLTVSEVSAADLHTEQQQLERARTQQTRSLSSTNLKDVLLAKQNIDNWQQVAEQCLSCGNCTSVCPTCFCHSEHDVAKLNGQDSEHLRQWSSCFTHDHSYIHGLNIRHSTALRYRQWMTHKLGTWHDQYQRSGCVGCGRCISWCPAGIDFTEVVNQLVNAND